MIKFASTGLYTLPQAGRMLGEEARTVRRWAFGYSRRRRTYPPPIKTEVPVRHGVRILIFLELVELLFIQGFLRAGVSWKKVRKASVTAARLLGDDPHPFALKKWFVDPVGIYLKLGEQYEEHVLLEVAGDAQVAIEATIQPYLQKIEFDISGLAQRWYPMGFGTPVVVDPRRSFGEPIVQGGGVRTQIIAEMSAAGDSVDTIAAWYDIDAYEVVAALMYEQTRQH